jgi:hypothetical protein
MYSTREGRMPLIPAKPSVSLSPKPHLSAAFGEPPNTDSREIAKFLSAHYHPRGWLQTISCLHSDNSDHASQSLPHLGLLHYHLLASKVATTPLAPIVATTPRASIVATQTMIVSGICLERVHRIPALQNSERNLLTCVGSPIKSTI